MSVKISLCILLMLACLCSCGKKKQEDYTTPAVSYSETTVPIETTTKKVTDVLDKAGLDYEIYSDIKANPTIDNCQHGVKAFKASGADYLIAIGGGPSMDTSKAIGIVVANPEFSDIRSLEGVAPTKNKACLLYTSRCV